MSDGPQTPGGPPDPGLPNQATPVVRREFADPDLAGTARLVATSIQVLVAQVRRLNDRLVVIRRVIIGLLVLAALAGYTLWRQWGIDQDLQAAQTQIEITRSEVLCPLVLLTNENPVSREQHPFGVDAYDQAFAALKRSVRTLNCPPVP